MANKAISELPQALNVNNQDLFVLEQSGIAKKLTAETFITEQGIIDALAEALDGHGGISSVTLSSVSGRIRTYLITFTDGSATTFQVYDGTTIERIAKTSTAGLVDTYTVFMNDGTTTFFTVTNGADGEVSSSSIATTFDPATSYTKGNYVWYGGQLYVFTSNHTAGAWDQSDVESVAIGNDLSNLKNAISANNSVMLAEATPTNYVFELGQIAGGTGIESDSTVRARTPDYIPYKNDEIVLHIGADYTAAVIYYDVNRNYKIGHWWFTGDYVVKGNSRDEIINTGFVRIVIKRTNDGIIDLDDVNAKVKIGLKGNYKRSYTVALDGSGDFDSLVTAVYAAEDHMDSTVYIKAGVYDMLADLGTDVVNNIDAGHRGLYLKNRIHLIGSGDTLITCLYSGERELTARWLSIFNAGIYGFTIENLRLSGENIRYIIHDERDSDEDSYINKYINCRMVFDNTENQYSTAVQCIGGGLGLYGVIVIDNCYFNSINSQNASIPAVSYHNSADVSSKNGQSLITVSNSFFENNNTIRINYYGNSTKITQAFINNCSLGKEIISEAETQDSSSSNVNVNVTAFNNIVRDNPTITAILGILDSGFTNTERCDNLVNVSLMIQNLNIGTSWTDVAYISLPPTKNQLFSVYDHTNFEALEGYILSGTGHIYMRAKQALTGCSVRAGFSYSIA